MSRIEIADLSRYYTQGKTVVRALDGVDLTIDQGEFVSVVGRSGSGKTTLLDLVGLLLRPTRGDVIVDGVDATRLSDGARADIRGRRIGFVSQAYNLLPSLDVVENVMLPLRYAGVATRDGRTRARQLLDL